MGQALCWAGRAPAPAQQCAPCRAELKCQRSGRADKGFGVLHHGVGIRRVPGLTYRLRSGLGRVMRLQSDGAESRMPGRPALCLPRALGASAGLGACCPGLGTPTPMAGQRGLGGARPRPGSVLSCLLRGYHGYQGLRTLPVARPIGCVPRTGSLATGDGPAVTGAWFPPLPQHSTAADVLSSRSPAGAPKWASPARIRLWARLPALLENLFLAFSSFWKLPASLGMWPLPPPSRPATWPLGAPRPIFSGASASSVGRRRCGLLLLRHSGAVLGSTGTSTALG